jgi:hypothetical protein
MSPTDAHKDVIGLGTYLTAKEMFFLDSHMDAREEHDLFDSVAFRLYIAQNVS